MSDHDVDDFDASLRERLTRLGAAVPVGGRRASDPTRVVPGRVTSRPASIGWVAVGTVVVALLAISLGAGMLGGRTNPSAGPTAIGSAPMTGESPSALESPAAPSSNPSPGLVARDVATDGTFELTLTSAVARYTAGEPIQVRATLSYVGPGASITIFHGAGVDQSPLSFGVVEPIIGNLVLEPGQDTVCLQSTLQRGTPIVEPFAKSGSWSGGDPRAPEYEAFMADPDLTLPAGVWHVLVVAHLAVGDCAGKDHELQAEITIQVDPPGATPIRS